MKTHNLCSGASMDKFFDSDEDKRTPPRSNPRRTRDKQPFLLLLEQNPDSGYCSRVSPVMLCQKMSSCPARNQAN
eukprot:1150799-Pelagomonas_calceolata.AAC.1